MNNNMQINTNVELSLKASTSDWIQRYFWRMLIKLFAGHKPLTQLFTYQKNRLPARSFSECSKPCNRIAIRNFQDSRRSVEWLEKASQPQPGYHNAKALWLCPPKAWIYISEFHQPSEKWRQYLVVTVDHVGVSRFFLLFTKLSRAKPNIKFFLHIRSKKTVMLWIESLSGANETENWNIPTTPTLYAVVTNRLSLQRLLFCRIFFTGLAAVATYRF